MASVFQDDPTLIFEIRQGLERECLRVDQNANISLRPHPPELGSKLTHPHITTDYSENLLEYISSVHTNTRSLMGELLELHAFTLKNLEDELLWPSSMPAILPEDEQDIPLAYYGESNVGKLKTLYRRGLGSRYGRRMQSIAGIHYNISFSDNFWNYLHHLEKSDLSLKEYKNQRYFGIIRNFNRYRWILMYLFGASPAVDSSFLKNRPHKLEKLGEDTLFSPYGCSLRMGGLGYTSEAQKDISICYNCVESYIETLEEARLTPYPAYEKIGLKNKEGDYLQLNTHLLQIDNEYYSTIRPKNIARTRESALMALHKRGVEYLEYRLLDVDPRYPLGVSRDTILFMHIFMAFCLDKNSPPITDEQCREYDQNFAKITVEGRRPGLNLLKNGKEISRDDFLMEMMDEMNNTVSALASVDSEYERAFKVQLDKINNPDLIPSAEMLELISKKGYKDIHLEFAKSHLDAYTISDEKFKLLQSMSTNSWKAQADIEAEDKLGFDDFLVEYFKNIKIEV